MKKVTPAVEEYLETIYRLEKRDGVAKTNDLVLALSVAAGTVTNTVERLEREKLVTHEPYKGVKLTEQGKRIALDVLRRHRLSERLLTDFLNFDWGEAHEAACRLEHGVTSRIANKLEEVLGHPSTCPHGNPIPAINGTIAEESSRPLVELQENEEGMISRIAHEKTDILSYLKNQGLVPGVSVEIIQKAPFEGPITLRTSQNTIVVSQKMASIIEVQDQKQKVGGAHSHE